MRATLLFGAAKFSNRIFDFPAICQYNYPMDVLAILAAFGLVLLNGFFVATEFAIVKVRPTRIEELIRERRHGAKSVQQIIGQLDGYLSATQLGITIASLGLGWIGKPAFARLLEPPLSALGITEPGWMHSISAATAFMTISFLHIVVGELAPKSIALLRAETVALWASMPMRIFHWLFFPAIWTLNGVSNLLLRLLGVPNDNPDGAAGHSPEEIKIILSQARSAGLLSAPREELMRKALVLPNKTLHNLMVPRSDVIFLDINHNTAENIQKAFSSGHRRFPLCDRELDNVVGVVDIRELLYLSHSDGNDEFNIDLQEVATDVPFFPEMMSGERLLSEFRARHVAMAMVVDEYGGTAGIVTPADIVTAVLGELADDDDDIEVVRLPGGAFDIDGVAELSEVQETLGITLPETEFRTVAGFLMERLGRMPRTGDKVTEGGLSFSVVAVNGPKIETVRIKAEN